MTFEYNQIIYSRNYRREVGDTTTLPAPYLGVRIGVKGKEGGGTPGGFVTLTMEDTIHSVVHWLYN